MIVHNCAPTSFWRRNNNSDCRGHDLHGPEKDYSIAIDSCRTHRGCQRDSSTNHCKALEIAKTKVHRGNAVSLGTHAVASSSTMCHSRRFATARRNDHMRPHGGASCSESKQEAKPTLVEEKTEHRRNVTQTMVRAVWLHRQVWLEREMHHPTQCLPDIHPSALMFVLSQLVRPASPNDGPPADPFLALLNVFIINLMSKTKGSLCERRLPRGASASWASLSRQKGPSTSSHHQEHPLHLPTLDVHLRAPPTAPTQELSLPCAPQCLSDIFVAWLGQTFPPTEESIHLHRTSALIPSIFPWDQTPSRQFGEKQSGEKHEQFPSPTLHLNVVRRPPFGDLVEANFHCTSKHSSHELGNAPHDHGLDFKHMDEIDNVQTAETDFGHP